MVCGRSLARQFRLVLTAVACATVASTATPGFAQTPAAPSAARGDPAGRVPIEGAPRSFDSELARLLRREPAPDSLFEARRQAERAAETVAKLLESEGYYAASVTPLAEGVDHFTRRVKVVTGPLFIIAGRGIALDAGKLDPVTQNDIEQLLGPLDTGVPARAQPVLDVEDAILRKLKLSGYPDARANTIDALADGEEQTMEITYHLVPGPRTSFGRLTIEGLGLTKRAFIEKLQPWPDNAGYSEAKLDELRARLAETGLFTSAGVSLAPEAQTQTQAAGDDAAYPVQRDVDVKLIERERKTIALGASASTSEGIGLNGEWTLRNWSGWGDSVTLSGQLASLQSFLETDYRLPNIDHYGRNLKLTARAANTQTDAYDQIGATLGATLEEQLTPRLRGSLGVEGGYASIADVQARTLGSTRRNVWLADIVGTAEYTGVRDILDPKDGVRARINVEPGVTYGDTSIVYTRLSGEASIYATLFTPNLTGAVRGKIGAIIGPNGAPPDKLFFAGGGGSVRGYEYQSLSPRDADNVPLGGRSLVETSFELRYRINNTFGAVAFIDAGAAGDDINPPINSMRAGAGFGLRYYAGFGPLRADLAFPLNKRTGDADFQIYISIGQAF
jgi:translocation and assembly module TamA